MATTKNEVTLTNKVDLTVIKVEKESVIVKVDGWRIRLYFDKYLTKEDISKLSTGRIVNAEYSGELSKVHTLKFLPLKKI